MVSGEFFNMTGEWDSAITISNKSKILYIHYNSINIINFKAHKILNSIYHLQSK